MDKKGQVELGAVPTLVITLVIIGICIGVGAIVVQQMGTASTINPDISTSQNISGIKTSAVVYNLTAQPVTAGSITYCNQTGGALSSVNYTLYTNNATVVFHSNFLSGNGSYCYASYTYGQQSAAYNVTAQANAGLGTFADFQSVIAIILVAAVVVGLAVGIAMYARA